MLDLVGLLVVSAVSFQEKLALPLRESIANVPRITLRVHGFRNVSLCGLKCRNVVRNTYYAALSLRVFRNRALNRV